VISETIQGLPASVDAEKSVLGGILLENGLIHEAGAVLAPDDFYLQSHRKIYTAMLGLAASGKPIELVSLGEELGSDKDSVGGMSYLSSLTDGVPRRQVIDHYYSLIREKSNLRRLANIGQQITALAIEQEETSESLCGRAQELILSVSGEATQQHAKPAKDFMLRTLSEMERQSQVDGLLGMSTGISGLDEVTSGIREGEMWVIGAMPGRGKTGRRENSRMAHLRRRCLRTKYSPVSLSRTPVHPPPQGKANSRRLPDAGRRSGGKGSTAPRAKDSQHTTQGGQGRNKGR
jgi:replicative DNA helicase